MLITNYRVKITQKQAIYCTVAARQQNDAENEKKSMLNPFFGNKYHIGLLFAHNVVSLTILYLSLLIEACAQLCTLGVHLQFQRQCYACI